jgi:hypothetical protein
MQNKQLHDELLSVHKISQAFPGTPRVSKPMTTEVQTTAPHSSAKACRDGDRVSMARRVTKSDEDANSRHNGISRNNDVRTQ